MAKNSTKKSKGKRGTEKIKNQENLEIMRDRLFSLTDGYTCSELETLTGISDSTIKSISNGNRQNPKIDNLISIAKAIHSSIDYIVGLTPYNTSSLEERDICNKLGLSYEAFKKLEAYLVNNRFKEIIDSLLQHHRTFFLLDCLDSFLSYLPTEENIDDLNIRREDMEEVYLKRLNRELLSFKYSSDEAINSLNEHLKDINNKISEIQNKPHNNDPNDKFKELKHELEIRKDEIENQLKDMIGE